MPDRKPVALTGPGTIKDERAPWESWDAEMDDPDITPELAAEIDEYAQNHYEDGQSSEESREILAMWRERNNEAAEEYQWATKAEYQNEEERQGNPLTHAEYINKLRAIGIQCFYRQHPHDDKAVLYVVNNGKEELACWVQKGFMPELSILNFDEHGVPLAEKRRGWRTPLLQMILKGYISEELANKTFGKPKLTAAYSRYNATLFEFRNRDSHWEENS